MQRNARIPGAKTCDTERTYPHRVKGALFSNRKVFMTPPSKHPFFKGALIDAAQLESADAVFEDWRLSRGRVDQFRRTR